MHNDKHVERPQYSDGQARCSSLHGAALRRRGDFVSDTLVGNVGEQAIDRVQAVALCCLLDEGRNVLESIWHIELEVRQSKQHRTESIDNNV